MLFFLDKPIYFCLPRWRQSDAERIAGWFHMDMELDDKSAKYLIMGVVPNCVWKSCYACYAAEAYYACYAAEGARGWQFCSHGPTNNVLFFILRERMSSVPVSFLQFVWNSCGGGAYRLSLTVYQWQVFAVAGETQITTLDVNVHNVYTHKHLN